MNINKKTTEELMGGKMRFYKNKTKKIINLKYCKNKSNNISKKK